MKKIGLLITLTIIFSVSLVEAAYIDEYPEAYNWAFENGITTQETIEKANMDGEITRIALSKMISNYAINVLNKKTDSSKKCQFADVPDKLNTQYDLGVTKACQLGLMGQGISNFRPYDNVTRAEVGTIISRLLWGDKYNGGNPYYKKHLNQLNLRGIMTNIKNAEKGNELRGNVMVILKRSQELGNIEIPSFEELKKETSITCHYEEFGDERDSIMTKKDFILPYKDGYFTYDIGGQDGLGLYVYYRLEKNPCTTYLNSDEILWWPTEGQNMTKIYKDYDNNVVAKVLNCKIGDYEGCYKEVEKYAYNLLVGNETNEHFSLRMDVLKRMVDNKEFIDKNKDGFLINRSQKRMDCYDYYSNKTDKTDNLREYCYYEVMGICPDADFCKELKPKLDNQFGGNNVIYEKEGNNKIVGDKTYFYSEKYGIRILLGKYFSGGMTSFREKENGKYVASLLITKYNKDNPSYDVLGRRGQEYAMYITIYDINKDISEELELNNSSIIGKNNKYQFTKKAYDKNANYDDLKIFNVK